MVAPDSNGWGFNPQGRLLRVCEEWLFCRAANVGLEALSRSGFSYLMGNALITRISPIFLDFKIYTLTTTFFPYV